MARCSECGCDCKVGIDATRDAMQIVTCDDCTGTARCPRDHTLLTDDGYCSTCRGYPIDTEDN